jgi:hypothetical protein
MTTSRSSTSTFVLVGAALLAACSAPPMERVPVCRPEPFSGPYPPPAPQVVVTDGPSSNPPVVLHQVTVATMSEAERTERLRAVPPASPAYTPAPLPEPAPRTVVVRHVTRDVCVDPYSYDYDDRPRYYRDPYYYGPAAELGRVATYTAAGAIIGHQFHERGRGAAIGFGLALLGAPFWGWHHRGGWCWGD